MGKKSRSNLAVMGFRHRLRLVAESRGISINQLHREAGVFPAYTREVIRRGYNPTFKLIRRLIEPQKVSLSAFCGDITTLSAHLKVGENK